MTIELQNILNQSKKIEIEKNKITVLTAHNGFGKSTIHNYARIQNGDEYVNVTSFNASLSKDHEWFFLSKEIPKTDEWKKIMENIKFYEKLLSSDLFSEKETIALKRLITSFRLYIIKSQPSFEFNLCELDYIKHFKDYAENISEEIDEDFFDNIKQFYELINVGVTDNNGNQVNYSVRKINKDTQAVTLKINWDGVYMDQEEIVREKFKVFNSRINDLLKNMNDLDWSLFQEMISLNFIEHLLNNNNVILVPLKNSLIDIFMPGIFYGCNSIDKLIKLAIQISQKEYSKLLSYIKESPLEASFVKRTRKGHILVKKNMSRSTGEMKWISNIISIIKHQNSKKILAFDDPLDSLDSFYSSQFLKILENSRIERIFILTHRTNIMRIGTHSNYEYVFYDLFLEKIKKSLLSYLTTRSFVDLTDANEDSIGILIAALLFMRFSFKNINHTYYDILSDTVKEDTKPTISCLKSIIIDILGHGRWRVLFSQHETKLIKEIISSNNTNFCLMVNRVIWKSENKKTSPYINTLRHLSESEPLDIFLIDKKQFSEIKTFNDKFLKEERDTLTNRFTLTRELLF